MAFKEHNLFDMVKRRPLRRSIQGDDDDDDSVLASAVSATDLKIPTGMLKFLQTA